MLWVQLMFVVESALEIAAVCVPLGILGFTVKPTLDLQKVPPHIGTLQGVVGGSALWYFCSQLRGIGKLLPQRPQTITRTKNIITISLVVVLLFILIT